MRLELNLTSSGRPVSGESPKILDRIGMTIGRGGDSDWILLDPERHLSKTHCSIEYHDGIYLLTDTSTNGVYLNDTPKRMVRDQPVTLNDGDVLRLGDYEIMVRLLPDQGTGAANDPFSDLPEPYEEPRPSGPDRPAQAAESFDALDDFVANLDAPNPGPLGDLDHLVPAPAEPGSANPDPLADPLAGGSGALIPDDADPFLSGSDGGPQDDDWSGASHSDHAAREQEFFQPPKVSGGIIPDDWDDLGAGSAVKKAPPRPASEAAPQAPPRRPAADRSGPAPASDGAGQGGAGLDEAALLRAFLAGAGLDKLNVPPEQMDDLMRTAGQTFRQMVEGLCQVLMARSSIKNEFRIERTVLQPKENNPLKFSVTPEEAMRALLSPTAAGYLPAGHAVKEGFNDLQAHQIAVMAGMQVAMRSLLQRFDPDALTKRLERDSLMDKVRPGARKAHYWDVFTELYQEIAREAEDDFQNLFGREFSRAYEKQSRKL